MDVTVSKMNPGITYNLYRYTDEKKVPTEKFNKNSKNKAYSVQKITSKTGSYNFKETIRSSEKVFYRCVASTDP